MKPRAPMTTNNEPEAGLRLARYFASAVSVADSIGAGIADIRNAVIDRVAGGTVVADVVVPDRREIARLARHLSPAQIAGIGAVWAGARAVPHGAGTGFTGSGEAKGDEGGGDKSRLDREHLNFVSG